MKIKCIIKSGLFFVFGFIWLSSVGQTNQNEGDKSSKQDEEKSSFDAPKREVKTSAVTVSDLLSGKPGIYAIQNGVIGNAAQLMIRGVNTINMNASPFIYIDGVPVRYTRSLPSFLSIYEPSRLNFIDPDDVKNISVSREGSDLSFVGGRGSNGAVYIETDRGELGGTKIDFSAKFGLMTADYDINHMGASQFKTYLHSYMLENGASEGELNQNPIFSTTLPQYNNNTDWKKLVTRDASYRDYHLKLKGGDGDACYMFSVGYTKKEETIDESDLQRVSMRFNLDYKLSPKIEISNNLSYTNMISNYSEQGYNYAISPLFVAATKAPFLSPYLFSSAGELTRQISNTDDLGKSNPVALVRDMNNSNEENRVDGIISSKMYIAKQTFFRSAFAFNYFNMMEKQYRPSLGIVNDLNRLRQNSKRSSSEFMISWNSWLEKNGTFGSASRYSGKGGFSVESYEEKSIFVRKINAGSDDYETLEQGTVDSTSNIKYRSKLLMLYINGDIDLFNRLAIAANMNFEGSSNFGSEGRWGLYPGVKGVLDLLNRKGKNQISLLGSWGRTGNNDLRGYYHNSLYYPANYFGYGGVYLGNIANEKIKPEITDTYDVGLSFNLFNKRLVLDGGYYLKNTDDLITQRAVPIELGLAPQFENSGSVTSEGLELSLNAKLIDRKNLTFSVYGNLSTLKNKVNKLNNGDIIKSIGNVSTIAREGESIGAFYGYKVLGVFRTESAVNLTKPDGTNYKAGDYMIDDLNHDSKINIADRQVIGSALPDLFGNFGTTFCYRRITLDAQFTYSVGNDIYNSFNQQMHLMKDYSNQSTDVENRWISEANPGNGLNRAAYDDPSGNGVASNLWIEDGSYIRLKNITISYEIPLKEKMKFFRRLNVYFTGENLLTFTGYKGFDPEVVTSPDPMLRGVDFGSSPVPHSYILGIKMSF